MPRSPGRPATVQLRVQRHLSSNSRLSAAAFTLIEVIAVLLILSILLLIFLPNMQGYMQRAGEARCMANMRAITVALHCYLQDHGNVWPQGPSPENRQPWEQFWLSTLKPYDINERTWQCPTIRSSPGFRATSASDRPRVHYTPTMFNATPGIATRWATHPWLIERSSVHPHGALICFPDGSIKPFDKVLAEQGVR